MIQKWKRLGSKRLVTATDTTDTTDTTDNMDSSIMDNSNILIMDSVHLSGKTNSSAQNRSTLRLSHNTPHPSLIRNHPRLNMDHQRFIIKSQKPSTVHQRLMANQRLTVHLRQPMKLQLTTLRPTILQPTALLPMRPQHTVLLPTVLQPMRPQHTALLPKILHHTILLPINPQPIALLPIALLPTALQLLPTVHQLQLTVLLLRLTPHHLIPLLNTVSQHHQDCLNPVMPPITSPTSHQHHRYKYGSI
jgi:hypothetical protein